MPTMTDVRTLAASETVNNVLAGKTNEFLAEDSVVRVGMNSDTVGQFFSLLIGDVNVVNDQEMGVAATAFPKDPDDIIVDDVGQQGDRLVLGVRNSSAVATPIIRTLVKVTPT